MCMFLFYYLSFPYSLFQDPETLALLQNMDRKLTEDDRTQCTRVMQGYIAGRISDPITAGSSYLYFSHFVEKHLLSENTFLMYMSLLQ